MWAIRTGPLDKKGETQIVHANSFPKLNAAELFLQNLLCPMEHLG